MKLGVFHLIVNASELEWRPMEGVECENEHMCRVFVPPGGYHAGGTICVVPNVYYF